ncbi:hypothetical protein HDU97_007490 [Phlyctochytrium planicorne]|nr:hypothetical protein HDU97_007490 [Phlyctochytrium planicorne]
MASVAIVASPLPPPAPTSASSSAATSASSSASSASPASSAAASSVPGSGGSPAGTASSTSSSSASSHDPAAIHHHPLLSMHHLVSSAANTDSSMLLASSSLPSASHAANMDMASMSAEAFLSARFKTKPVTDHPTLASTTLATTATPQTVTKRTPAAALLPPEVWSNVAQHLQAAGTLPAQRALYGLCLLRSDIHNVTVPHLYRSPVVDGFRQTNRFIKCIHLNLATVRKLSVTLPPSPPTSLPSSPSPRTATFSATHPSNASLILSLEKAARNPDGWLDEILPHAKNVVIPTKCFWTDDLPHDAYGIEKMVTDGFLRDDGKGTKSTLQSLVLTGGNRERLWLLSDGLEKRAEARKREKEAAAVMSAVTASVESQVSSVTSSSSFWSAPLPRGSGKSVSEPPKPAGSKTWGGGFFGGSDFDTPAPPSKSFLTSSPFPPSSSLSSPSASPSSFSSPFPSRLAPSSLNTTSKPPASGRRSPRDEDPVLAETTTHEKIVNVLLPSDKKLATLFPHFYDLRRLVFHERCATAAADAVLRCAVLNCGVQLRQIAIVGGNIGVSEGEVKGGGVRFTRLSFQSIWWGCPNLEDLRVEKVDLSNGKEGGAGGGGMDWCGGSRSSPLSRPLIHVRDKLRKLTLRDCVTPEANLLSECLPLAPNLECLDLGNLTLSLPSTNWRMIWQTCLEVGVFGKLPGKLVSLRVSWSPPCGVPIPADTLVVLGRRCSRLIDLQLEGMARLPGLDPILGVGSTSPTANGSPLGGERAPASPGGSLTNLTGSTGTLAGSGAAPSFLLHHSYPAGSAAAASLSSLSLSCRNTPPGSPQQLRKAMPVAAQGAINKLGGSTGKLNASATPSKLGGSTSPQGSQYVATSLVLARGTSGASAAEKGVGVSLAVAAGYNPSPPASPKLGRQAMNGAKKAASSLGNLVNGSNNALNALALSTSGVSGTAANTSGTSPSSPPAAFPKLPMRLQTLDLRFTSYLSDAMVQMIATSGLCLTLRHLLFRPEQGGGFTDAGLGVIATQMIALVTLGIVPAHGVGGGNRSPNGMGSGLLSGTASPLGSALSSPVGSLSNLSVMTTGSGLVTIPATRCTEVGLANVVENLTRLREFVPPVFSTASSPLGLSATSASGSMLSPSTSPLSPPSAGGSSNNISPSSFTPSQLKIRALLNRMKRRGCRVWDPAEFLAASGAVGGSSPSSAGLGGSPLSPLGSGNGDAASPLEVRAFGWEWGCEDDEVDEDGGVRVTSA